MRLPTLLAVILALAASAPAQQTLRVPQDFATIQAAVSAAADGDTILVSAGTYAESVEIEDLDDVVLRGVGKVVIAPPAGPGLLLHYGDAVTVEHIRVLGGDPGIRLEQTNDSVLRKCRVEAALTDGIRIEGSAGNRVEHCIVTESGSRGIVVVDDEGAFPELVTLADCKVIRPTAGGIVLTGRGHVVERCRVLDAGNIGISAADVDENADILITRCRVVRSTYYGIVIGGDSVSVTDSKVVRCQGFGIAHAGGSSGEIRECRVVRASIHGIVFTPQVEGAFVADCRISRAGEDGIYLDGSGHSVQDNHISRSVDDGLDVHADACTLSGNRIRCSTGDGIVLSEGEENVLGGNKAHGSDGFDFHDIAQQPTNIVDDTNTFGTVGP